MNNMSRLITASAGATFLALSQAVTAASSGVNSGSAMTTGPASDHNSIFAASSNPAASSIMLKDDENWRINYFPSFAINAELGEVDNFADDLDELIDIIDDPGSTTDSATEVLDRFNGVLVQMGESGYIKTNVQVHLPIVPLYFKLSGVEGVFSADLSFNAQIGLRILDDVLSFDAQNTTFATNTAIYLKSGIEQQLSFGYSQPVWSRSGNTLYAGAKLKYINLELSKQTTRLLDLDGAEVQDVIEDEYDKNLESSTNFALDFGVVWDAQWYRAGLTLENLNSPSFSYGAVGQNCITRDEGTIERNSCEVARYFVDEGRLDSREEHTKHALLRADGIVFITDQWSVNTSLDLAEYDDVVGFQNQWFHLATSYQAKGRWMPSPRFGYQTNLAGTKLDTLNFGLTFFKTVSFDLEYSTSSADVDGTSTPRKIGFAFSISESF